MVEHERGRRDRLYEGERVRLSRDTGRGRDGRETGRRSNTDTSDSDALRRLRPVGEHDEGGAEWKSLILPRCFELECHEWAESRLSGAADRQSAGCSE
jgi:hypothetical protein